MMIMEWDQQQENQSQNQREDGVNLNVNNGVMYVKVMTDEQLETLRKQIAVYASICEQLVEMHKNLTAQQDLTGGRLGNLYCDPLMTSGGHKISARQRWTPTAVQLQILERIFDEGTGTPSKQKIKEITSELSQHGPISETNVYNWFQNRRARSKRKQVMVASSSNNNNNHNNAGESEVETEVESPKTKPENLLLVSEGQGQHHDVCFQNPEITSQLHFLGVGDDHMSAKRMGGSYHIYDQAWQGE